MDNTFELLGILHKSFMDLHNERMNEISKASENIHTETSDNTEALDQIDKDLEELLK